MCHSSIDRTMNYYTHILIADKASAVGLLPDFGISRVVRNGADNMVNIICKSEGYGKGCYSGKNCSIKTKIGDFEGAVSEGDCAKEKTVNSLDSKELTVCSLGTRSRIRTVDLLIKSNIVEGRNSKNSNMLQGDDVSVGYDYGKSSDDDCVKMESDFNETESVSNNDVEVRTGSVNSIVEAILVINQLPFLSEEKVKFIRAMMNDIV